MHPAPPPPEDPIRPHSFDGIQEYDKRLPNWWLYTLHVTILFWVGYWSYYEWFRIGPTDEKSVDIAMARIEAARLASVTSIDDASLWKMSRNPTFVEAGRATYLANCAACHLPNMRGKSANPAAIGPDLTDTKWIHGGTPTQVYELIGKGVLAKGMPTWTPVLGPRKVSEVTAFVLSVHQEGEAIVVEGTTSQD